MRRRMFFFVGEEVLSHICEENILQPFTRYIVSLEAGAEQDAAGW